MIMSPAHLFPINQQFFKYFCLFQIIIPILRYLKEFTQILRMHVFPLESSSLLVDSNVKNLQQVDKLFC